MSPHDIFADACREAFAPLVRSYHFSEPEVEPIGRECFVRFHKGAKTVSIAWGPDGNPVVELFYPAGPCDSVEPWAARGSVPYARRIPRLGPRVPYDSVNAEGAVKHLRESMAKLAEAEGAFLDG